MFITLLFIDSTNHRTIADIDQLINERNTIENQSKIHQMINWNSKCCEIITTSQSFFQSNRFYSRRESLFLSSLSIVWYRAIEWESTIRPNYTFKHLLFRHIIWLFKQWYVGPLVIDDVDVDHDGYEFVGGRLKQWKIAVVLLFVIYALHKMHWTDYEHDLCVCCLCVLFVLCVIFCDRTMAFVIFFFYICAFFTTFIVLLFAWFYGIILCNVVRLHSLDFHTFAVSRCAFELISARWVCFFSFVCCCDFCFFFRTLHIGFFHIYILQMTYELYAHMYNHSHRDF